MDGDHISIRQEYIPFSRVKNGLIGGHGKGLVVRRGTGCSRTTELRECMMRDEQHADRRQYAYQTMHTDRTRDKTAAPGDHSLSPLPGPPLSGPLEFHSLFSVLDSHPALSTPAAAYPV